MLDFGRHPCRGHERKKKGKLQYGPGLSAVLYSESSQNGVKLSFQHVALRWPLTKQLKYSAVIFFCLPVYSDVPKVKRPKLSLLHGLKNAP